MPQLAPYLTIPEAAALLRVCRRTIEYRIADGTLQSFKVGGVRRIVSDSLLSAIVSTPIGATSVRAHTWDDKPHLSGTYKPVAPNAKRIARK